MAKPTNKQEFADFILRRLGAPMVNIELTDHQLEDVIDTAIQFYQDYHYDGTQRSYRTICLDSEVFAGNMRGHQCMNAPYYDPTATYVVGDRVRATIDKNQGERVWIKYDSEESITSYKFVEYPSGDWVLVNGDSEYKIYDSETHNKYHLDVNTRGDWVNFNTRYDSDLHTIYVYTPEANVTFATDIIGMGLFVNNNGVFTRAANVFNNATFTKEYSPAAANTFVSFDSDVVPLNTTTKKVFTFSGPTNTVVDSDGNGNVLAAQPLLANMVMVYTFASDKTTVAITVNNPAIVDEILEPVLHGRIAFLGGAGAVVTQTFNVRDPNQTLNFDYLTETYSVLTAAGAVDSDATGLFVGKNPKWYLRENGIEEFLESVTIEYNNGSPILPTAGAYINITKADPTLAFELPILIDGVDSGEVAETIFENLDGLSVNYNTVTTELTLVDGTGATLSAGTGIIAMSHPAQIAAGNITATMEDFHIWQGEFQNALNDNRIEDLYYLGGTVNVAVTKNGLPTTVVATTDQTYAAGYVINYNELLDTFTLLNSNGTPVSTTDQLATATFLIEDKLLLADSEVQIGFIGGTRLPAAQVVELLSTIPDSDLNNRVTMTWGTDAASTKTVTTETFAVFDISMRDVTGDLILDIDTHGLYQRSLIDPTTVFYNRDSGTSPTRYDRYRTVNGKRYIRLEEGATRKYEFQDLWALETAVLNEAELNVDYSKSGQVGIPIPEDIHSIVKVFKYPYMGSSTNMLNNFDYQLFQNYVGWNTLFNGGGWGAMTDIYIAKQYLETIDDLMNVQPAIRFNKHKNRLYLDTSWSRVKSSGATYLLAEVYEITDPEVFGNVYKDVWLQRYATALAKKQWGSNLKKYTGSELPGGITIDGQALYDEGKEEAKELEDEAKSASLELDFFIG